MKELITCPFCGAKIKKQELYENDCLCADCHGFIDYDSILSFENNIDETKDPYLEWYDDYYSQERFNFPLYENEDFEDITFSCIVNISTDLKPSEIRGIIELIDGEIDYLETKKGGIIETFCNSKEGRELLTGMSIDSYDKFTEYVLKIDFISSPENKVSILSTIFEQFPLSVIREEYSNYIMASNKGLAKGLFTVTAGDEDDLLSYYLTGYEKFILLKHVLTNISPYKENDAKDIMIKWQDDSLISLSALSIVKKIPGQWQCFLDGQSYISLSLSDTDPGENLYFDTIINKSFSSIKKDIDMIKVVSVRGIKEYAIEI